MLTNTYLKTGYATLIIGSLAFFQGVANAVTLKTVSVLYHWRLETSGEFETKAISKLYENENFEHKSDVFNGAFTAKFIHIAPANGTLIDTLPTNVTLQGKVGFYAYLRNETFAESTTIFGNKIAVDTYAKASALTNLLSPESFTEAKIGANLSGEADQKRAFSVNLIKDQAFSVNGSVDVETKYGLDLNLVGKPYVYANAHIKVFDYKLLNSSGTLTYEVEVEEVPEPNSSETPKHETKEVPEPITLLGTVTAIGFGSFFKRELAKKQSRNKGKVKA